MDTVAATIAARAATTIAWRAMLEMVTLTTTPVMDTSPSFTPKTTSRIDLAAGGAWVASTVDDDIKASFAPPGRSRSLPGHPSAARPRGYESGPRPVLKTGSSPNETTWSTGGRRRGGGVNAGERRPTYSTPTMTSWS